MRVQLRRATTAAWAAANPVLAAGEPGEDTTTGTLKMGDGVTAWLSLPAANAAAATAAAVAAIAAAYSAWASPTSLGASVTAGAPAPQQRTEPGGITRLRGQLILGATTFVANSVLATLAGGAGTTWPNADATFLTRTTVGNVQSLLTIKAADGTIRNVSSITATGTDTINLDGFTFSNTT
jgi:hypothetical protein